MKKLLSILVFSLLFGGSAYAEDVILECKLINQIVTTNGETNVYSAQDLNSPIDLDNVFKINSQFETVFSYNRYSEKFEPISRSGKNFKLYWSENEINWSFVNPIIQGASNTNSLNRNTGKLVQKIFFDKTSATYKNTRISYSASTSQCQIKEKLF